MKLSVINTGLFKLDGGAMFGVVPRRMWQKLNPPDDNNMCTWAMRCLLIETDTRKILVDTGIGNKQDDKFRSHFEPHGTDSLLASLEQKGVSVNDITDVFQTHLHFDHCGGAVHQDDNGKLSPTFPNATYWTNQQHWDWAMNPNPRERASFLKENFVPLQEAGVLKMIEVNPDGLTDWVDGIQIRLANGHTESMMLLYIPVGNKTVVYCADLIPSAYHIGLPYVMSYDIRPLITMAEKKVFLEEAVANEYLLFFEHDPHTESATITKNERGKYKIKEVITIEDFQKMEA